MQRAGKLRATPGPGVAEVRDDVRNALATIGERDRSEDRNRTAGPEEREIKRVIDPALNRVFERQGGGEAIPKRKGVGEKGHVRVNRVVETQVGEILHGKIGIREERGDPTGGKTAKLDIGLIDLRIGGDLTIAGGHAGVAVDLVADIRPDQPVRGVRPVMRSNRPRARKPLMSCTRVKGST